MKALFFSLFVCLSTLITLQAQEAYLPLSVTNRAAENAYHGATYLASNVNFEKGRVEIDRALELDPDFFMAHVYLYQVFADDDEKQAITKKALAIDPTNFTKAEKIMRRQMEAWAEEPEATPTAAMEELVAAYPQTTEAYEWAYLHAAYTENNMESAYGYAQKLLQLDSNFGPAYNFLGYYYMGAKEMDKAKAAFEKYIELNEMEANAYDSMGEFYLVTGDYATSTEYYDRAVELGMENAQSRADQARAADICQQSGLISDPKNIAVIDGLYQAFAKGDIPTVLSILDEKVVWNEAEGNALADGNPYVGPDAVLNGVFARIGAEHEYFNLKDIKLHTMDGNQVLATLRYDAKRKDNGALIDAQVAHLWTLSDGKVTAFQQYVDTKQLADAAASQ